jgi:transcriptional regulator with XRE-family HTH domain
MTRNMLGNYVRERRQELGLSQETLAERVGGNTVQSDISRIERGQIELPRPSTLINLAAALEVPVGNLLIASGWFDEAHLATPESASAPGDQSAMLETLNDLESEITAIRELEREAQERTAEVMKTVRTLKASLSEPVTLISAD